MMREIVLDTETTGLNPLEGHRIIEIGALEMVNQVPTGETYHIYINPERPIDPDAMAVHGITDERVAGEPVFADLVDGFLEFIGNDVLVIHNAPFDVSFINAELQRCGKTTISMDRVVDTLVLARKKFPGAQASLDALCRRFNIDNSHRELHGALIDADLLSEVYIELMGGKQRGLSLMMDSEPVSAITNQDPSSALPSPNSERRAPRPHQASEDERLAHQEFISGLKDPLWSRYDTSLGSATTDDAS